MSFPNTRLPVTVELQLSGTWTDVTSDVLVRNGIEITRGRPNESAHASASTCNLSFKDATGKYSDRNPLSPYYGVLGRNTPIRVGVGRLADTFNGRTVVDGWGTTSDGTGTWTLVGTASAFDVGSGVGTLVTSGVTRLAHVGAYGDVEVLAKLSIDSLTSDPEFGVATHVQSNGDCWVATIRTVGTDALAMQKFSGSGAGVYAPTYTIPSGVVAGTWYWIRVQHVGHLVRARVWVDGAAEPTVWHVSEWDTQPSSLPVVPPSGGAGIMARLGSSTVVSVDSFSVDSWRFHGEVTSWPQRWDTSGNDVWVPITASGIMRRLEQGGSKQLKSALYREATSSTNSEFMLGYWPCEDASGSTQIASGLAGGKPMTVTIAQPNYASSSDVFTGSDPLPTMVNNALIGNVASRTSTGVLSFRGLFHIPAAGLTDLALIADIRQAGSSVGIWRLRYHTGGALSVQAIGTDGTVLVSGSAISFDVRNKRLMIGFSVEQNGSDVDWHIFTREVDDNGDVIELGFNNTFTSLTVGSARQLVVAASGLMSDCVVGHLMLGNSTSLAALMDTALVGHAGETAAARMTRLASEEGSVTVNIVGDPDTTALCGPQRSASLLELFRDAANADGGILYEPRYELALAYRTRRSLNEQEAALALDYAAQEVAPPLEPLPDDQGLVNDYTASRLGGSSYRATRTTGRLSTQDPPDGAGVYESAPPAVNVLSDGQLPDIAGWGVHLGTWDEARYPVINVNHARLGVDGKTDLSAAAVAVDVGDRVTIDNPPAWLPPDQIAVLVEGYSESLNAFEWRQSYNASPAGPWDVGVYGDDTDPGPDRYDTAASFNAGNFTSGTDSTLLVVTSSGPLWTTDATTISVSAPMDIRLSGARVRVTGVSSSARDTFTRTVGAGSLGTADTGGAYTLSGTASEFSVNGSQAVISTAVINSERHATLAIGYGNFQDVRVWNTIGVTPTGAPINWGALLRYTDANNYIWADVQVETSGALTLRFIKRISAAATQVTTATALTTHSTTVPRILRAQIDINNRFRCKVYSSDVDEPSDWPIDVTEATLPTGTSAGFIYRRATGNTNAGSVSALFDNFAVLNPQLFTVSTTVVNGVNKFITPGQSLRLWTPAVYAR